MNKKDACRLLQLGEMIKIRKVGAVILVLDSFMHPPHLRFSCDRIEKGTFKRSKNKLNELPHFINCDFHKIALG